MNSEAIPITTSPNPAHPITVGRKGQFHGLEVMLIFIAWMLLLAFIWNHSAQLIATEKEQRINEKTFQRAQAQSQALIAQHNINPWLGCAYVDAGKKRTRSHEIEIACLSQLANTSPSINIHEVALQIGIQKQIFYSNPIPSENCSGIQRLVIAHETQEIALLSVIACA